MKIRLKQLSIVGLGLISSAGQVLAHAGEDEFAHHSGMMGWMYGGSMGFFGWLIWLLVAVALILLIVWLIKQISKK